MKDTSQEQVQLRTVEQFGHFPVKQVMGEKC